MLKNRTTKKRKDLKVVTIRIIGLERRDPHRRWTLCFVTVRFSHSYFCIGEYRMTRMFELEIEEL